VKPLDLFSYAFKGLKDRRARSALTILGIMIGILAVVMLISNTQGFDHFLTDVLSRIGSNNIWIIPAKESLKLTDTDVMKLTRLPGVKAASPFYLSRVIFRSGSIEESANLIAVDPRVLKLILPDLELGEGTMLQPNDLGTASLGYKIAHPPEDPNKRVNLYSSITVNIQEGSVINSYTFMVGGIFKEFGSTPYLDVDKSVLITINAARNIFKSTSYPSIVLVARSPDDVEPIINMLKQIYGDDVEIISPLTIVRHVKAILGNFSLFMLIVASVSLIVAGIGIMNTMIMSVMERTREIGILRALGFSQKDVATVFLTEAALIGIIGGILGVSMGVVSSTVMGGIFARMFRVENPSTGFARGLEFSYSPVITPELLGMSFIFAIIVGLASGLYPALKAARMDPVQALRTE